MIPLFKPEIPKYAVDNLQFEVSQGRIGRSQIAKALVSKIQSTLAIDSRIVFVNSGTSGLHAALEAIDVEGSEVIVPCQSFMATGLAVLYARAKPHFCDVDSTTGNICTEHLNQIFSNSKSLPRAIIAVHWGGNPCDIEKISDISRKYDVPIIYDCAHALSSRWRNQSVFAYGTAAVGSFQAIKEITSGDGGLVAVNTQTKNSIDTFTWFGMQRDPGRTLAYSGKVGFKYDLNNIAGSLLLPQIGDIVTKRSIRQDLARQYNAVVPKESRVVIASDSDPSYWLYSLLVSEPKYFCEFMSSRSIEVSHVDIDISLNPVFQVKERLPGVTKFNSTHIAIPCRHNMTTNEVEAVLDALEIYFK